MQKPNGEILLIRKICDRTVDDQIDLTGCVEVNISQHQTSHLLFTRLKYFKIQSQKRISMSKISIDETEEDQKFCFGNFLHRKWWKNSIKCSSKFPSAQFQSCKYLICKYTNNAIYHGYRVLKNISNFCFFLKILLTYFIYKSCIVTNKLTSSNCPVEVEMERNGHHIDRSDTRYTIRTTKLSSWRTIWEVQLPIMEDVTRWSSPLWTRPKIKKTTGAAFSIMWWLIKKTNYRQL